MNDTLEIFVEKISKEMELPSSTQLTPDDEFRKIEKWDSMNALIILAFINVEYGKGFTAQKLGVCRTFRDVYEIISGD